MSALLCPRCFSMDAYYCQDLKQGVCRRCKVHFVGSEIMGMEPPQEFLSLEDELKDFLGKCLDGEARDFLFGDERSEGDPRGK